MVYLTILNTVVAAGTCFIILNFMTPFLYELWYNNLDDEVTDSSLVTSGNNAFSSWQIMGYIIPGIIMAYGFSTAARERTRDDVA